MKNNRPMVVAVVAHYRDGLTFLAIAEQMGWQTCFDGGRSRVAGLLYRHLPQSVRRRGSSTMGTLKKYSIHQYIAAKKLRKRGLFFREIAVALNVSAKGAARLVREDNRVAADAQNPIGCRFIFGDTGPNAGWYYCGSKRQRPSFYCEEHDILCHLSKEEIRRNKATAKQRQREFLIRVKRR